MKLKKVISLALGGVMAMSMLTACGTKTITNTITETVEVQVVASIVDEAENVVEAGQNQTDGTAAQYKLLPLDDNDEAHKAFAESLLNSTKTTAGSSTKTVLTYLKDTVAVGTQTLTEMVNTDKNTATSYWINKKGVDKNKLAAGETYMTAISADYAKTNAQIGSDLGEAILERAKTDNQILIDSVSVFKVTIGSVSGDLDLTGSQYEGTIYYVIVVTMAENNANSNVGSST